MATNLSDEYREEPVKFPCSLCSKENETVKSSKYCADCVEYLCTTCLKVHSRLSSTSGHVVSDVSSILLTMDRATTIGIKLNATGSKSREINGMCIVRRDNRLLLVITEWQTQQIMVIDLDSKKCVTTLKMESKPYGVHYLPVSGMLVATLYDSVEMAIIELTNKLKLSIKRYVEVSRFCRGLHVIPGVFSDSLVVVRGEHSQYVDVYDVLTEKAEFYRIKHLSPLTMNREHSLFPINIVVDAKRKKLYLTDRNAGVIVLDVNGKRIGTLSKRCIVDACAICADDDGNVYVGGMVSENVVKFDADGTFAGEIVNKSHGIKCPISMCFDTTTRSLIIGSKDDFQVNVVKL